MACACGSGAGKTKVFVWTSADGSRKLERSSEIEVKYLVERKGGSYKAKA